MDTSSAAQHLRWTESHMPLMKDIAREFEETQPFRGIRIGVSLHLEVKTVVLVLALRRGGADVVAAGNYGTTQDDIVALLRANGIDEPGSGSDTREEHLAAVRSIVESEPDLLLDNGADLIKLAVDLDVPVLGATEETTSGHMRLTTELESLVTVPVIVINDSPLKANVENKRGRSVGIRVLLPDDEPDAAIAVDPGGRRRMVRTGHRSLRAGKRRPRLCGRD